MQSNSLYAAPRIQWIDFVRGAGLLGILIMNIQTYTLFALLKPGQVYELHLDKPETYAPVQFFIHLFVKGQFYTFYSFLFGLGFYLMWKKNVRLGLNAGRIFRQKMWILLIIGLIHAFFFWFGDVLHKYALLGFTLPFFYKKSVNDILKWIGGIVTFVVVFQVAPAVNFVPSLQPNSEFLKSANNQIMEFVQTWQHGSPADIWIRQWRAIGILYLKNYEGGFVDIAHCEMMFLFGMVAGKLNVLNRLGDFRLLMMRLSLWLFPVALLMKAISCLPVIGISLGLVGLNQYQGMFFSLAEFFAIPVLSLVYLAEIAMLFPRRPPRFLRWIANAGRMSLTNYLMQTLLCMAVFYGYSGALAGKVTLLESLLIAVLMYIIQLIYSNLWFKYRQFGPVEKLLRHWIYLKAKQSLRAVEPVILKD